MQMSVYPYELVLGETRAFEFEGFALSSEDRYAVTEETECSATMESRPVTEAMQFSVAGNFSLCYYYAGVGFAVVKELLVREITYEGPTVFVNGVPDAVFVYGLTEEDTVRFVRGVDCEEGVLVEEPYTEGMNVTLRVTLSPISVCYKLGSRRDYYRDVAVVRSMGVEYVSSEEWLTAVHSLPDTFVFHPAFLEVGDEVVFESAKATVSSTVRAL